MIKLYTFCAVLFWGTFYSQTFIPAYQERVNFLSQENINTYLQEIEALGVKKTGSAANNNARAWLKSKYLSFGYSEEQIVEDPFSFGSTSSKNLIVTKTGTKYPDTYVIICGHYDSIVGPGVSDNGSGVAIILELARILKDVPTDYSIRFINFSGEEQGLYGSYHYVEDVVNATTPKMDIKLVFNIDQVGGKAGNDNSTIYCDKDQSRPNGNNSASEEITSQLAICTELYSPLKTAFDPAYASDYVPFQENGEVITGFYEYKRSYNEHTVQDTYANIDTLYVYNVGKAALGAAQHFAVASSENLSSLDTWIDQHQITFYPNPAKDILYVDFVNPKAEKFTVQLTDFSGEIILKEDNRREINISRLPSGVYLATLRYGNNTVTRKIQIK